MKTFTGQQFQKVYKKTVPFIYSKILLVKSEVGDVVSVVTSQNLTRGNRHESAFISTDPDIFNTLFAQVNDLIRNHSVPLNELFQQRLQQ